MDDNPSSTNPNHPESSESEYDGSFMSTSVEADTDSSDDKKLTISKVAVVEVSPSPDTDNATQTINPPTSRPLLDISDPESVIKAAKLIANFASEIERLGGVKFLEDLEKIRNNQTPPKSNTDPPSTSISADPENPKPEEASGSQSGTSQAQETKEAQTSTATGETVAIKDHDVPAKAEEITAKDQAVQAAPPEKEKSSPEESPANDDDTKGARESSEEDPPKDASLDTTTEKKDQESSVEDGKEDGKEDVTPEGIEKKDEPQKDESPKEESKAESTDDDPKETDSEVKEEGTKEEEGEAKESDVKDKAKEGETKEGEAKEETTDENKPEEAKEEAKEEVREETPEEVKQEPPPAPAPAPLPLPDPPHDPFKGVRADPTETEEIPLDANGKPKPSASRPGMPILPALCRRWVAKESDGVELLAPEKEWERRKKELGEKSLAIDQLMAMVGLEQVKSEFLAVKSTIDAAKNRRGMLRRQEFNLALIGNPGTGKKTLATIYRTLLKECAAWSSVNSPHNEKRSGFDFQADKDIEGFHLVLNNYGENSKVFVFIDSIEGMTGSLRADLLYTLDRHAERLRLVVVIAGTETAMNKLLASRPSGRWQFPRRLTIKDYDDEQLRLIFLQMVRHNGFTIEGGETGPYPRIVAKRVARNRESGGFANAYDLVLAWEKILDRQAARLDLEHAAWKAAEDKRAEEWEAALEKKRANLRELLKENQSLQATKEWLTEELEVATHKLEEKKQEREHLKEKALSSSESSVTEPKDVEKPEGAVKTEAVAQPTEVLKTEEPAQAEAVENAVEPETEAVEVEGEGLKTVEEGVKPVEEDVKPVEEDVKPDQGGVKPESEAVKVGEEGADTNQGGVKPTGEDVEPEKEGVESAKEKVDPEKEEVKSAEEEATPKQEAANSEPEDVGKDAKVDKEDLKENQRVLSPEEVEIAAKIEELKKAIEEGEEMLSSLVEYKNCRGQEITARLIKLLKYKKLPMPVSVDDKTSVPKEPSEKSEMSTDNDSKDERTEVQKADPSSAEGKTKPNLDEKNLELEKDGDKKDGGLEKDEDASKNEDASKDEEPEKEVEPSWDMESTKDAESSTKDIKTSQDEKPAREEGATDGETTAEDEAKARQLTEQDTKADTDGQSDKKSTEGETKAEDEKSASTDESDESDEVDLSFLSQGPAPKPNTRLLTKEDIIGPEPEDIRDKSKAWKELEKMAGLESVKKAIGELLDRAKANYRREVLGKEPLKTSLNQVFLGPPGTGKTTVAKLYGQILAEIGLLSTKEVVFKTPADFIGQYIGESEVKTAHILDSTIGKVLIIDDAHMFYHGGRPGTTHESDEFRLSCIDVMISKIHNQPGEDRCVLLLGYPDMMEEMFQKCNPGLRRRFPLEEAFRFQSYDDKTLNEILRLKMAKEEITADEGAMEVAAEVLRRARDRPNFGNGGDVDNLLNQAKTRYRARTKAKAEAEAESVEKKCTEKPVELPPVTRVDIEEAVAGEQLAQAQVDLPTAVKTKAAEPPTDSTQPEEEELESPPPTETTDKPTDNADILTHSEASIVLTREDFDPDWNRGATASSKCKSLFSSLIGFESIISKFEGYQRLAANMRRRGKDPREIVPFTFIFKGPPGTGKTHTARIIGQIFYHMGFLSTNEVIECSASNLIGQYMGHTSPKVINLFEKALGKVLFIDEAYRLGGGNRATGHASYEEEAIGELVDCMTKPRYLRKMIIVLAGYDKDMDNLMKVNAGLRGRFATEINFPTMTASKAKQHLENLLLKEDIELRDEFDPGEEEREKVLRYLHQLGKTAGWANARDVKSLAAAVTGQVYRDVDLDELEREENEEEVVKRKLLRISTKELNGHLREMLKQRMRSGGVA